MAIRKVLSFIALACRFNVSMCMEPLAALAVQPVWQAGEPIAVNVDYDVPAFGPQDVASQLQSLSNVESGVEAALVHSHAVLEEDRFPRPMPEGRGSSSFLTTKVLPVDANRIKKSLYLTQSLRSPPQAAVNVIMREDVQHMQDASKYKGMVYQTQALQNEFRKGLAAMSNGNP